MHFGGGPVPLPEPFAELMRTHLANRPNMRTTNSAGSTWLFPGTRAGRHLHPNTLMTRLRQLGINPLGARNAALREGAGPRRRRASRLQHPDHPRSRCPSRRALQPLSRTQEHTANVLIAPVTKATSFLNEGRSSHRRAHPCGTLGDQHGPTSRVSCCPGLDSPTCRPPG